MKKKVLAILAAIAMAMFLVSMAINISVICVVGASLGSVLLGVFLFCGMECVSEIKISIFDRLASLERNQNRLAELEQKSLSKLCEIEQQHIQNTKVINEMIKNLESQFMSIVEQQTGNLVSVFEKGISRTEIVLGNVQNKLDISVEAIKSTGSVIDKGVNSINAQLEKNILTIEKLQENLTCEHETISSNIKECNVSVHNKANGISSKIEENANIVVSVLKEFNASVELNTNKTEEIIRKSHNDLTNLINRFEMIVPNIEKNTELIQSLIFLQNKLGDDLKKCQEERKKNIEEIKESLFDITSDLSNDMNDKIEDIYGSLKKFTENICDNFSDNVNNFTKDISKSIKELYDVMLITNDIIEGLKKTMSNLVSLRDKDQELTSQEQKFMQQLENIWVNKKK